MFKSGNNKKNNKSDRKAPVNPNAINTFVVGSHFDGNLTSENDIRIDGSMEGTLVCKSRLIIGNPGSFDGDAECRDAVIEGVFTGTLKVEETLQVKEKAVINGDIKTKKLIVQSGAIFNVSCKMGEQEVKAGKKPSEAEAAVKGGEKAKTS